MNNTALRIENGMSSFELLQAKVSSLEATEKCMSIEEDRRMAALMQWIAPITIHLHHAAHVFSFLLSFLFSVRH
mgnify:CR=1 FL=1